MRLLLLTATPGDTDHLDHVEPLPRPSAPPVRWLEKTTSLRLSISNFPDSFLY